MECELIGCEGDAIVRARWPTTNQLPRLSSR